MTISETLQSKRNLRLEYEDSENTPVGAAESLSARSDGGHSGESAELTSGTKPYRREGDHIYFGEYPRTIKAADVDITTAVDARGYYLGSDGAYYAKVTATPWDSGYKFTDGADIQKGATYYFRVEPIGWRILREKDNLAFVICDSIIANRRYAARDNNYAESEIRDWLNNEFLATAFSASQQGLIEITEVDNSPRSTFPDSDRTLWNGGINQYACANTRDRIFLLSEQEATMTDHGFSVSDSHGVTNTRCIKTTDYARATGAWMSTEADYYGNGWWWLRSPDYEHSHNVWYVYYVGNSNIDFAGDAEYGVAPALNIRL